MLRPIALWMSPRSRSSMVSRIFAEHGIWWGERQYQPFGYPVYESIAIKQLLKKHWGGLVVGKEASTSPVQAFLAELPPLVPHDRRWLFKVGVEWFNAFAPLTPFNVFIKRPPADIAASILRHRPNSRQNFVQLVRVASWRLACMDRLMRVHGGVVVDTDHVIAGNFDALKDAFEYCGLRFCQKTAARAIMSSKTPALH